MSQRLAPLFVIVSIAALACGDDGGTEPNLATGGSGGAAGPAGAGGKAGSSAKGGTGGAGGAAGKGGGLAGIGGIGGKVGGGAAGVAGTGGKIGIAGTGGGGSSGGGAAGAAAGAAGKAGSNAGGSNGGSNAGGMNAGGTSAGGTNGGGGSSAGGAGTGGNACAPTPPPTGPDVWRSKLFPADWKPVHAGGTRDAQGLALPDFAYAGYHRGEQRPPVGQGAPVVTVAANLGNGNTDATAGIQKAIDDTCKAGGGVVKIPAGTFKLTMPAGKNAALVIGCSKLVLRGEGPTTKLLFDDAKDFRQKSVLSITAGGNLLDGANTKTYALANDALETTTKLTLADVGTLKVGDPIVVRGDNTAGFRADHRMDQATSKLADLWPEAQFRGLIYPRTITAIDGKTITLDLPTQYPLKTRDAARVYAEPKIISEIGVEALAFGMVESKAGQTSTTNEDQNEDDWDKAGTLGYDVHAGVLISFGTIRDSWVSGVTTFEAPGNASKAHILSMGIVQGPASYRLHIEKTLIGRPQYRGAGGNGYAFALLGHDSVFVDSRSEHARHGITINNGTSGNVLLRMTMFHSRYASDTHRFLAHANLFDQVVLDDGWLQSVNRGTTSSGAGFTGTRLVFWNTIVEANHAIAKGCAVESAQFGDGYLIGSQSKGATTAKLCPESFTNGTWKALDAGTPKDFVEGEDIGEKLDPPSLYEAQKALRFAREGLVCPP